MSGSRAIRISAVAAVILAVSGCTGDDGGDTDGNGSAAPSNAVTVTASPRQIDDDGTFLAISEVGFGDDAYVALTNFTTVPASLDGLYLCDAPDCVALPDVEVEPGAVALITTGEGKDLEGVVLTDAQLELAPSDGEIGLYGSEDTESEDDIRDYLQWGSTPHEGTAAAIAAGQWLEGSYVNSAEDATRVFKGEDEKWTWE